MDRGLPIDVITVSNLNLYLATNGQAFRPLNVTLAGSNPAFRPLLVVKTNYLFPGIIIKSADYGCNPQDCKKGGCPIVCLVFVVVCHS
jgi:hypothetical protein